jgi:hypothetical protein
MTVLAHERNWIQWKADSCKSFEKVKVGTLKRNPKKLSPSAACDSSFLGNDDLTKLWAHSNALEEKLIANSTSSKKLVQSLDDTLQELDHQVGPDLETPLDGLERDYVLYNQMHFNWLSYRIAVASNLDLFENCSFDSDIPGKSLLGCWRRSRKSHEDLKRQAEMDIDLVPKKQRLSP